MKEPEKIESEPQDIGGIIEDYENGIINFDAMLQAYGEIRYEAGYNKGADEWAENLRIAAPKIKKEAVEAFRKSAVEELQSVLKNMKPDDEARGFAEAVLIIKSLKQLP